MIETGGYAFLAGHIRFFAKNLFENSGLQKSPITSKIGMCVNTARKEAEVEVQRFCF